MSNKLIDLNALSAYKTSSDAKYQDKLTAGSNITISNNVISAQTTVGQQTIYNVTIPLSGWSGTSNTVTVQGIAAGDDVEVVGINPTGLTDAQITAAREDLYLITYGTTSANAITFYALDGTPSADIPITVRKILNTTVTTREYSAGSGIDITSGVISATPVFGNTNITSVGSTSISAGSSDTTVYTATRNCKMTIEIQCQGTTTTAADLSVKLNGTRVYSQYMPVSQKYMRILHGFLMLKAGDVVSVNNPYSFAIEVPYTIMYD